MKFRILLFLFIASAVTANAQSKLVTDSLITELCKSVVTSRETNDSVRIEKAFELHLYPILRKLDDSAASQTYGYAFFRLQKLCKEFKTVLDRLYPAKGDWKSLEIKPASKLQKTSCRDFLKHKGYFYIDEDGDTVRLTITNNFWTDHFKDGTWSKLKLNWIDDCEFEIVFIESTNLSRQSLSKPGDKYNYRLIEKNDTYYLVCLEVKEVNVLGTFKIYYY